MFVEPYFKEENRLKTSTTFENKVKMYAELDTQEKAIKKQKDPLNKSIKEEMKSKGLSKFEHENIVVDYSVQERTSMNEDRLVMKLKSLGFDEAIKTVEVPDQAVIESLIYEGKLSPIELDDCIEKKRVEVLKVKVK